MVGKMIPLSWCLWMIDGNTDLQIAHVSKSSHKCLEKRTFFVPYDYKFVCGLFPSHFEKKEKIYVNVFVIFKTTS